MSLIDGPLSNVNEYARFKFFILCECKMLGNDGVAFIVQTGVEYFPPIRMGMSNVWRACVNAFQTTHALMFFARLRYFEGSEKLHIQTLSGSPGTG
jgi:hypothetical protein